MRSLSEKITKILKKLSAFLRILTTSKIWLTLNLIRAV